MEKVVESIDSNGELIDETPTVEVVNGVVVVTEHPNAVGRYDKKILEMFKEWYGR